MNEPLYEVGDWKSERAEASRTALRCSFSFRIRSGSKPKPMKRTERTNSLSCTKVEQLRELGFTDARSGSKGPISVRDSCALVISRSWAAARIGRYLFWSGVKDSVRIHRPRPDPTSNLIIPNTLGASTEVRTKT